MDLPFPQHAHNPYSQDIFSTESLARNYHSSFQNTNNYPRARSSMRLQNHNSLPNVRESPFSPSQQQPSEIPQRDVEEQENGHSVDEQEDGSNSDANRPSRISLRRRNLSTHAQILYNRNRLAICRALFFGLIAPIPIVVLVFLSKQPLILQLCSVLYLGMGLVDLAIFLFYHDRINDMVLFDGRERRTPKGCARQSNISRILLLFYLPIFGVFAFGIQDHALYQDYLWLLIIYGVLALCQVLGLFTLRMIKFYYFCAACFIWLFCAFVLAWVSLFSVICTCGKKVVGKNMNFWSLRSLKLTKQEIKHLLSLSKQANFVCAVCLQNMIAQKELLDLPCSDMHHFFHLKCGKQWILSHGTCPMCRRDYSHYLGQKSIWEKVWIYRPIQI